jgi:hypothetical protein
VALLTILDFERVWLTALQARVTVIVDGMRPTYFLERINWWPE